TRLEQSELTDEAREDAEAAACLASRSAFMDFNAWMIIHGIVDEDAAAVLKSLFHQSLSLMRDGKFRESVDSRKREFEKKCRIVREGFRHPATISSVTG